MAGKNLGTISNLKTTCQLLQEKKKMLASGSFLCANDMEIKGNADWTRGQNWMELLWSFTQILPH